MTFYLSHSVKFSGMIERNLGLLCFVMIFIMVASLHKPWLCMTITTMVLHPLKLCLAVGMVMANLRPVI